MSWSVAILSSRETPAVLMKVIEAAIAASADQAAIIDVVVNGNQPLADTIGRELARLRIDGNRRVRLWYVTLADKSHAWNQYLHDIWPEGDIAFFIDGYAEVMPDALKHIADGMSDVPHALCASGVATMGRSAKGMKERGQAHGNLYALRGDVVRQLRKAGFRFPLGLYRSDVLLFSVMCFALDPAKNKWDPSLILIVPEATWAFSPLRWWKLRDLKAHFSRVRRQAQGVLENRAVREHLAVRKQAPSQLARTARELVTSWVDTNPMRAARIFIRNPLCLVALRKLRRSDPAWSGATINPVLVAQRPPA